MRNRAASVIIEDNKVALIKRVRDEQTYYVFPGGGIENGETPRQAAIRETFEELGVEIQVTKIVKTIQYNGTQYYFLAQIIGGVFGNGKGEEFTNDCRHRGTYEPVWIALGELSALDVRPYEVAEELSKEVR